MIFQKIIHNNIKKSNIKLIIFSVILDVIGMLSFSIPFLGEFSDIIWAPISYYIMKKTYPGVKGHFVSIVSFLEELLPFTDVLPTFTLMAIYTISKKKIGLKNKMM